MTEIQSFFETTNNARRRISVTAHAGVAKKEAAGNKRLPAQPTVGRRVHVACSRPRAAATCGVFFRMLTPLLPMYGK